MLKPANVTFERLSHGAGLKGPMPVPDRAERAHALQQAHRLLDLYTTYIQQGFLPSNEELLNALDNGEDVVLDVLEEGHLSREGARLWVQVQRMIYLLRLFILDKNEDETLQALLHYSKAMVLDVAPKVSGVRLLRGCGDPWSACLAAELRSTTAHGSSSRPPLHSLHAPRTHTIRKPRPR
jgi:hypothetical protein